MKQHCSELFRTVYGGEPDITEFAPGRVNLIGEHTDYNGGHVMPCAISPGIYCAAKKRSDEKFRFYSENFPENGVMEISLNDSRNDIGWVSYPFSVIKTLCGFGYEIGGGADLLFCGDLPDGSGLSSSAAIEVVTGKVIGALFGLPVTGQIIALTGQYAENHYIGVRCGIMDQFASALGRKGNAILLDTETLAFSYYPLPKDTTVLIINSGVKHSLASSAYNERRSQCEQALAQLRSVCSAGSLCSLTPGEFEKYKHTITDDICRKRAKHAVYENARTLEAAAALQNGNAEQFGRLMNMSHISLRDDYEVSCAELDFLAETAQHTDGVYGARMTGGGFGGCTVNLVQKNKAEMISARICEEYRKLFGIAADVISI